MSKNCVQCRREFVVDDLDRAFYEKVSPVFAGKKYLIPEPTLCFPCRERRRMAWRNERSLFSRKCDKTGANLISMFPPETDFPVWKNSEWWGNENEALQFGREFDFSSSVFDQFAELQTKVPMLAAFKYSEDRLVNSDYTNCTGDLKDCYLVFV